VLAINSPGGQIDGINELANMIRAANGAKPITAYVDGLAASGAYWLASAAGRIVADESAQLGSIGVLATVVDDPEADERRGIKRYDIVSSQSPLKRTDPATDDGRQQLQAMVDSLAQLFIEKVAAFRGQSPEKVARDYGRGAVMGAREAVTMGLADGLGSLEGLLRAAAPAPVRNVRDAPGLRVAETPGRIEITTTGNVGIGAQAFDEGELEEETDEQQLNDDSTCACPPGEDNCECDKEDDESEGTAQEPDTSSIPEGESTLLQPTEERQRIAAILTCEEARGREELARVLALETNHPIEAALKILKAAPVAAKPAPNALDARMTQLGNPAVGTGSDGSGEDDSNAAEVQKILAFVPKARKRMHVQ
jgi:enoyl-CoA hydratase/carnithine racemase